MKHGRLIAIVTCVMLALLSCSSLAEGFVPALDPETECELQVYGNYANFESLEAEFDRFNEYYPNVFLEYSSLDNYNGSISLALNSAEAPDIYCIFAWMIDQEAYAELFAHAEDLASTDIDLSCIREGLLYTDPEGRVPMVPVLAGTYGMLVNEDIFAKEGLLIPTTWDGLLEACQALREAGYPSPVLGQTAPGGVYHVLSYPQVCADLLGQSGQVALLNALDPAGGEALRPMLEKVAEFATQGYADPEACAAMERDYPGAILRFFEGDVPLLFTNGDTVSGAKKRESLSEAYTARPFAYSFYPIPTDGGGGWYLDMTSMNFSVNRESAEKDMAVEFLRFLVSPEELGEMARVKRLISTAGEMRFQAPYEPFGAVDASRVVPELTVALSDPAVNQIRLAAWYVGTGAMTVDEAIAAYGTLQKP